MHILAENIPQRNVAQPDEKPRNRQQQNGEAYFRESVGFGFNERQNFGRVVFYRVECLFHRVVACQKRTNVLGDGSYAVFYSLTVFDVGYDRIYADHCYAEHDHADDGNIQNNPENRAEFDGNDRN